MTSGLRPGCYEIPHERLALFFARERSSQLTKGKILKSLIAAILSAAVILSAQFAFADSTTGTGTGGPGGAGGAGGTNHGGRGGNGGNGGGVQIGNGVGTGAHGSGNSSPNSSPNGGPGGVSAGTGGTGGTGGGAGSVSINSPVQDRIPGLAVAPGLAAAGTGVCLGSFSVGLSGPMAGVAFGKTVVDKGCERRSNSVILYQRGHVQAAEYLLKLDPEVKDALDFERSEGKFAPAAAGDPGSGEYRGVAPQGPGETIQSNLDNEIQAPRQSSVQS